MIKVAVIDDEPFARARIVRQLKKHDDIEILKEATCGNEGIQLINESDPDIVFLDIKMPDLNGFEVLESIQNANNPFVIISTAFSDFAIKAFEVEAIDYLLKPFDNKRFDQSIVRAKKYLEEKKNAEIGLHISNQEIENTEISAEPIIIHDKGFEIAISRDKISHVESYGNYLKIHTAQGTHLLRQTMNQLEEQLSDQIFLRIHRSFLVNLKQVTKVKYLTKNEYAFELNSGETIRSGRKYLTEIRNYLSMEI